MVSSFSSSGFYHDNYESQNNEIIDASKASNMRGKRAKQYKKLMQQYQITYGFREPYQVLIDADMVKDSDKFSMDLVGGLKKTLHGDVKPMITQCCMRHLYALSASGDQRSSAIIDKAKEFERRRCGHLPADYPEPLSAVDCLASVVDPKRTGRNKHRYVIASTDEEVRSKLEGILGTPFIFVRKSVMIMARMPENSQAEREKEERHKFRDYLKKSGPNKRKRDDEDDQKDKPEGTEEHPKKKKSFGPKQPNPLSVKKKAKRPNEAAEKARVDEKKESGKGAEMRTDGEPGATKQSGKRKRSRKHKSAAKFDATATPAEADTSDQDV